VRHLSLKTGSPLLVSITSGFIAQGQQGTTPSWHRMNSRVERSVKIVQPAFPEQILHRIETDGMRDRVQLVPFWITGNYSMQDSRRFKLLFGQNPFRRPRGRRFTSRCSGSLQPAGVATAPLSQSVAAVSPVAVSEGTQGGQALWRRQQTEDDKTAHIQHQTEHLHFIFTVYTLI